MIKTVLVTGGSGYIGSWVVRMLLEHGFEVKVAVRNLSRSSSYSHLIDIAGKRPELLSFFEADLLVDGSYDVAAASSDAIIHIASPFTLRYKNAELDLIRPAVEGTKNVLNAANRSSTVKKVVLTSSIAAVYGDNADLKDLNAEEFTEEFFNHSSTSRHQPYSYSKLLAEKEAWNMFSMQKKWELVVINPTLVMGPSLSVNSNSESLKIMNDLLRGWYRAGVPALQFGFVDVRDVALAHVLALKTENARGRHILMSEVASFLDIANIIRSEFPGKFKLPKKTLPKIFVMLVGWMFGFSTKFVSRNVGFAIIINNRKSIEELGLKYNPLHTTVTDMVKQMI